MTPEEKVRQWLIQKMVVEWGFPKGLLSVERKVGERRYDLVCYCKGGTPLLLVECKAKEEKSAALRQAFGYNETLKAPFVCVASPAEIHTFWQEEGKVVSVPFLPLYEELYEMAQRL